MPILERRLVVDSRFCYHCIKHCICAVMHKWCIHWSRFTPHTDGPHYCVQVSSDLALLKLSTDKQTFNSVQKPTIHFIPIISLNILVFLASFAQPFSVPRSHSPYIRTCLINTHPPMLNSKRRHYLWDRPSCDCCFLPPGGAGGTSSKLSADDELIQLCVGQQYKGYTSDTITTVCLVWGHSRFT